jgi:hypothetical protein
MLIDLKNIGGVAMRMVFFLLILFNVSSCIDNKLELKSGLNEDKKQTADSDLKVADEPVLVSGSYLACGAIENLSPDDVGCAVMNNNRKVSLPLEKISVVISVRDDSGSYGISNYSKLSPSSPWHWKFHVPSRYRISGIVKVQLYSKVVPVNASFESPIRVPSDFDLPDLTPSQVGLLGGHIDVDTSREYYPFGAGLTDAHVHEYDKKYQLNGLDFFNLIDVDLSNSNRFTSYQDNFKIVILNSNLSPGAVFIINGHKMGVETFNRLTKDLLFRIGPTQNLNEISLTELKLTFAIDSLLDGQVFKSSPKCVSANIPGLNGDYRNGALTIQFVSPNSIFDPLSGAAQTGLIWESAVFWHDSDCS